MRADIDWFAPRSEGCYWTLIRFWLQAFAEDDAGGLSEALKMFREEMGR